MTRNTRISAALVTVFAAVIVAIALASGGGSDPEPAVGETAGELQSSTPAPAASTPAAQVVRASDPRRLGPKGSSGVTFTEFLDFECESCRAAYPVVEELRRQYAGKVTFVLRYFPIESHRNAMNAATAVEAAHQQGKLEAMYKQMYETQESWGEQQESQAPLFRSFAKKLRLDMAQYDTDVKRQSTAARVREDVEAGRALGVQGTPSFFIDEQRIQPQSVQEIQQTLDAAIAAS